MLKSIHHRTPMNPLTNPRSVCNIVAAIEFDLKQLRIRNTSGIRKLRRRYSQVLKAEDADFVLRLARALCKIEAHRWFAYEVIVNHRSAFERLGETALQELGRCINSWWTVDAFARILSGPAWLKGYVPDDLILKWARSKDRWWRRAALVSTVALNVRSQGGTGDAPRTLRICRLLARDPDDMVAKALSWALRALVVHDPKAVQAFLDEHDAILAARVKREVKSKLKTGLKNARRKDYGK